LLLKRKISHPLISLQKLTCNQSFKAQIVQENLFIFTNKLMTFHSYNSNNTIRKLY
jgi:hypothetical protein